MKFWVRSLQKFILFTVALILLNPSLVQADVFEDALKEGTLSKSPNAFAHELQGG